MILRMVYEGDRGPTVLSESPTKQQIADAINDIDWNRFALLSLYEDDVNWLDGSGCLTPGFGLSMMLSRAGVQYVTESAPVSPIAMLPLFEAYLAGWEDRLFALLYDAQRRGLNSSEVAELRRAEEAEQLKPLMHQALEAAGALFRNHEYAAYVAKVSPFEAMLSATERKKLDIARRKAT